MSERTIKASYGSPSTPLRIGEIEIPCYVLEDGRRVIVMTGMISALGMSPGSASSGETDRLAQFAATRAIQPRISADSWDRLRDPVRFTATNGRPAKGYEATLLADICDAVLDARQAGELHYQQEHIAARCEVLVRAFARVGIIALVDEATGYQEARQRFALQKLLDKYLRLEYARWAKRFPDDFYRHIFRLRGWDFDETTSKRPGAVAQYTKDIVYKRLAPGILTELEERNPKGSTGRRKAKHHQWLTEEVGHPALESHLTGVTALMRAASNWTQFQRMLDRAYPRLGDTLELDFPDTAADPFE